RHRDALGPRALVDHPDHARAGARTRAIGGAALDLAGEVPAGTPAGRGHARAPHLAAVERDRAHPHDRFVAVGRGIGHGLDDEPAGDFGIDDDGAVAHGTPPPGRIRYPLALGTPGG